MYEINIAANLSKQWKNRGYEICCVRACVANQLRAAKEKK